MICILTILLTETGRAVPLSLRQRDPTAVPVCGLHGSPVARMNWVRATWQCCSTAMTTARPGSILPLRLSILMLPHLSPSLSSGHWMTALCGFPGHSIRLLAMLSALTAEWVPGLRSARIPGHPWMNGSGQHLPVCLKVAATVRSPF